MATILLPRDFSAFLKLLNEHEVKYLLVGGWAVGYYGYVRATADLDVWALNKRENAERLVNALQAFGFTVPELNAELFLVENRVIRMGVPPIRIEVLTSISGVEFEQCYAERVVEQWDEMIVNIISLPRLKQNKQASGRLKDLVDLEYLN